MEQIDIWTDEKPDEMSYQQVDPENEHENELNQQNKNLRLLIPIYRIEQNKNKVGGSSESAVWSTLMESVDTIYLSILALEYYAAYALSRESIPVNEVISYLQSRVLQMLPKLGDEESRRIVAWIHDSLCNQSENYKAFNFSYYDPVKQIQQRYEFWLIKIEKVGDGNECKITEAGVSALLTYINANPKLQDEITTLLTQRLISMGRYDEALQMAERSRKKVIQYQEQITFTSEKLRREEKAGKLSEVVLPLIKESSEHVKERVKEEDQTLKSLNAIECSKLDVSTVRLVAKLKAIITDNLDAYHRLYEHIDQTHKSFETTFRSFMRPSSRTIPNMVNDLLMPLCKWKIETLSEYGDPIIDRIMPPKVPAIFDVMTLLDRLDIAGEQEYQEKTKEEYPDIQEIERIKPLFPEDMIESCKLYYKNQLTNKQKTSLLELLKEAERDMFSEEFQRCLSYIVILSYSDNESIQNKDMGINIHQGERFHHHFITGDDLSIEARGSEYDR